MLRVAIEGGEADWTKMTREEGCDYDHHGEIDMATLEPLIAKPSSPGNVVLEHPAHRSRLSPARPRRPQDDRPCGDRRAQLWSGLVARTRCDRTAKSWPAHRRRQELRPHPSPEPDQHGVLPLLFADPDDHETLAQGDVLVAGGLHGLLAAGEAVPLEVKGADRTIETAHHLTKREIDVLLAGGLINWRRNALAA